MPASRAWTVPRLVSDLVDDYGWPHGSARALAAMILVQGLDDLAQLKRGRVEKQYGNWLSSAARCERMRKDLREWIVGPDFGLVCDLLDEDPKKVLRLSGLIELIGGEDV